MGDLQTPDTDHRSRDHHHSRHHHHQKTSSHHRHTSSSSRHKEESKSSSSHRRYHSHSSRRSTSRPSKRQRQDSNEDEDDEDEDELRLKSRKNKLAVDANSSDNDDDDDEEGEWVIDNSNLPPPPPTSDKLTSTRESWMLASDQQEFQGIGSKFDFGSFAGESEKKSDSENKKSVFNRPAKKATDPYFVRSAAVEEETNQEAISRSPSPPPRPKLSTLSPSAQDAPAVNETVLNKMKAAYMKARLRKAPDAEQLENEYHEALAQFDDRGKKDNTDKVEVLSLMDTRGVLTAPTKTEEEMTIADMVAEEKRSRGFANSSEGRILADRIGRDKKFKADLDYIDENADKLARRVQKSQIDLKNIAIDEVHKMNHILDTCPLCQTEEAPPIAPVVAMGTRVYLSLPTMPQLSPGAASIVPIAHRRSSLECDDDEWDEIRVYKIQANFNERRTTN